jgi:cytochrome c oxidase subunit 3
VSLGVAFGALITGIILWAIIVRQLTVKPWEMQLATPTAGAEGDAEASRTPSAKIGLWVFLAVITSLFALFISAYYMRMGHGHTVADWSPVIEPHVLWFNTFSLIISSVAMQWARASLLRGEARKTFEGLLLAGLLTLVFLSGQYYAWQQLEAAGFFSPSNPALAFFYMLTAVHGLHLLGGLFVWARTMLRMRQREFELINAKLSIELCAIYWHYLLIVWLVLFALLLST